MRIVYEWKRLFFVVNFWNIVLMRKTFRSYILQNIDLFILEYWMGEVQF